MDVLLENWRPILQAFGVTVEMMLAAGLIAMLVGSLLAAMRVSPIPLARAFGTGYVWTVRNTPLLVIMVLFAFGLPEIEVRPELNLNSWLGLETSHRLLNFNVFFIFATAALGLYTAAFVCEALRSGINSVHLGQAEAARAVGMTFTQTLRHIVLPQAFRAVIAPLASVLIAMTKNTSVAVGVGVTEATFMMRKLTNDNATALIAIFLGFALGYMVLVAIISAIANFLERKVKVA
ncbi:MAG: amino acid ABC transporter permease [Nocardioides sp.]|nr:amino acid ABC transporter permease [Nocardioides sp.]